jgi:hypothetical protein
MRVNLKGVHKVHARLSNGEVVTYHYAWRGGPRIDAPPGTEAFIAAYGDAQKKRRAPPKGLLFTLISEYRSSSDFPQNKNTARNYNYYLKLIKTNSETYPVPPEQGWQAYRRKVRQDPGGGNPQAGS